MHLFLIRRSISAADSIGTACTTAAAVTLLLFTTHLASHRYCTSNLDSNNSLIVYKRATNNSEVNSNRNPFPMAAEPTQNHMRANV